jgi:hypothetical protein
MRAAPAYHPGPICAQSAEYFFVSSGVFSAAFGTAAAAHQARVGVSQHATQTANGAAAEKKTQARVSRGWPDVLFRQRRSPIGGSA